jgi:hypothetical protein
MQYNKDMLSDLKERKAMIQEKKQPIYEIARLMNQYHSVGRAEHLDEEQKKEAYERLCRQMYAVSNKKLSSSFTNKLSVYMSDWDIWESEILSIL